MEQENYNLSQFELKDYLLILKKRFRLIVFMLFIVVLVTSLYTFSSPNIYRATATLMIGEEERRSPLTGELVDSQPYLSQQLTFRTHFKNIKSKPVLRKVLREIEIAEDDRSSGLLNQYLDEVKKNINKLISTVSNKIYSNNIKKEGFIDDVQGEELNKIMMLSDKINIEEVRNTRLLNINVEDTDPRLARDIANSLAKAYVNYETEMKFDSSRRTMDWLTKQLYQMKKNVEDAEQAFISFKERENLFSIEGIQKINVQKIEEMSAEAIDTKTKILEIEAKIKELNKFITNNREGRIDSIPTFLSNSFIEKLYSDLLEAEVELKRIEGLYKSKHPDIILVTSKINELKSKIKIELNKALDNANSEKAVLQARYQALQNAMDQFEKEAINVNKKEMQYNIIERDVTTNRQLYSTLLSKVKESNIIGDITKSNIQISEEAVAPIKPIRPRKALNIALGIILGLMGGVFISFLLHYLDRTIHNREEVDRYIGLPILAEIPKEKNRLIKYRRTKVVWPNIYDLPINSRYAESFKSLATNLKYSDVTGHRSILCVTSSCPQEGKTTISYNLATVLASFNSKILIIDSDLRIPYLTKACGLEKNEGLTDILIKTFGAKIENGSISTLSVGDLHCLIGIQEKTGILNYSSRSEEFKVSFHKGRIVDIEWPTRPAEERLGEQLVRSGKITRKQAEIALDTQKRTYQRFGQTLLDLGFVTTEELAGPLKLHIRESLQQLVSCQGAEFRFVEDNMGSVPILNNHEENLLSIMGDIGKQTIKKTPILNRHIQKRLSNGTIDNLKILGSGKLPPNPTELLTSKRMKVLLEMLRDEFDVIILDSPPIGSISDASILSKISDGVIFGIAAGSVRVEEIQRCIERLKSVESSIMGVVLNKLEPKHDPYLYGYYYNKYSKYYSRNDVPKRKENKNSG